MTVRILLVKVMSWYFGIREDAQLLAIARHYEVQGKSDE